MTSYTLSYWTKVDGEWVRVVKPIEAPCLDAAKTEAENILKETNLFTHNITLEPGDGRLNSSEAAKRKKNTQAWKPRQYGRHA
jgi:hypothetical protein